MPGLKNYFKLIVHLHALCITSLVHVLVQKSVIACLLVKMSAIYVKIAFAIVQCLWGLLLGMLLMVTSFRISFLYGYYSVLYESG